MSTEKPLITILDYGAGNIYSITKALERLGANVEVTLSGARITSGQGFVLPGVGAFKDAMSSSVPPPKDLHIAGDAPNKYNTSQPNRWKFRTNPRY